MTDAPEANGVSEIRPHEAAMREAMAWYNGEHGPDGQKYKRDPQKALLAYHGACVAVQKEPEPTSHEQHGEIRAAWGIAASLGKGALFPDGYFAGGEDEPDFEPESHLNDPLYWLEKAERTANALYGSTDSEEAFREGAAAQAVRAGITLSRIIDRELATHRLPHSLDAQNVLRLFANAWQNLLRYESRGLKGRIDQNRINMAGTYAVALALLDSRDKGLAQANVAFDLGMKSESSDLPTSRENLGWRERRKAQIRHTGRAVGAAAVSILATGQPSQRRRIALHVARRII